MSTNTAPSEPVNFGFGGDGWRPNRGRRIALRIVGVIAFIVLAMPATLALTTGHPVMGSVLLGIGTLFLAIPGSATNTRANPPRIVEVPAAGSASAKTKIRGLLIPVNPLSTPELVGLGVLAVAVLIGALVLLVGVFAGHWLNLFGVVVLGAIGALYISNIRTLVTQARDPNRGLVLTPSSVVVRLGLAPDVVAWDQIDEVRDHWQQWSISPGSPVSNLLTVERVGEEPDPRALDTAMLGMDPELARDIVRFYLTHPANRKELGTQQALSRVSTLAERVAETKDEDEE